MSNPFKSRRVRSWAALIAAYSIVLHSVFGGIVQAQQSALAHGATTVICYGNGDPQNESGTGKGSLRHIPCALCAVAGPVAPPPEEISLPLPLLQSGIALLAAADHERNLQRLFSPRLSQGPPLTV